MKLNIQQLAMVYSALRMSQKVAQFTIESAHSTDAERAEAREDLTIINSILAQEVTTS